MYRVLMQDEVNGKKFNFAIEVDAGTGVAAKYAANQEFPGATAVEARLLEEGVSHVVA